MLRLLRTGVTFEGDNEISFHSLAKRTNNALNFTGVFLPILNSGMESKLLNTFF